LSGQAERAEVVHAGDPECAVPALVTAGRRRAARTATMA
jgi:hypothetical protein